MIESVVIDDEKHGRDLLVHMLRQYCPKINVCGEAGHISAAVELLHLKKPDLVFLDIEMPGGSGFDLIERTRHLDYSIIFVTGYDQYAIKAIKHAAMDYLLKPVDLGELKKAVDRAEEKITREKGNIPISDVDGGEAQGIFISAKGEALLIDPPGILYLESHGNYTVIYQKDSKKRTVSKNLNYFEKKLSEKGFYRIHRGFIVNLKRVRRVEVGRKGKAILENGQQLPIAVRRKKDFIKALQDLKS